MEKLSHILKGGGEMCGTNRVDNRIGNIFGSADCNIEKQGKYRAALFGAGRFGRHFDLWDESVFFVSKYDFYYCAESAYGFDMRISRNSGGFTAFLYSDFKFAIEISQKYFFTGKRLDKL